MGFSFAVVELFAFHPFRHRGKRPGGALLAVELLAGLLAQLFLRDELLHTGTLVLWQNLDRLKMGEINFEHALERVSKIPEAHFRRL